jgi:hypothetical protein
MNNLYRIALRISTVHIKANLLKKQTKSQQDNDKSSNKKQLTIINYVFILSCCVLIFVAIFVLFCFKFMTNCIAIWSCFFNKLALVCTVLAFKVKIFSFTHSPCLTQSRDVEFYSARFACSISIKLNDEFERGRVKPEIATLSKTQNLDFKW